MKQCRNVVLLSDSYTLYQVTTSVIIVELLYVNYDGDNLLFFLGNEAQHGWDKRIKVAEISNFDKMGGGGGVNIKWGGGILTEYP